MSRLLIVATILLAAAAAWIFATTPAASHPDLPAEPAVINGLGDEQRVLTPPPRTDDPVPPRWVSSPPAGLPGPPAVGQNPCLTPDPGFGEYEGWQDLPSGQMLVPSHPATDDHGDLRVVFHFHGHEAARKEWVTVTNDVVLVALDLGNNSSAYSGPFGDASRFETLVDDVRERLSQTLGRAVSIGPVALSAWSAGYAAVRGILQNNDRHPVDAVLLLDGLHATSLQTAAGRAELQAFAEFARRAARDEVLMFVSHSSIEPPDYISTTQGTHYLIWQTGGQPSPASDTASFDAALELYQRFDHGGFHALGFRGVTKEDHCAQVAVYGYALRKYLLPRWGLEAKR